MSKCICCDKELSFNDIGFHKKLVNRGASENFRCIKCTSEYFGLTEEQAHDMIENFKRQGCLLFV